MNSTALDLSTALDPSTALDSSTTLAPSTTGRTAAHLDRAELLDLLARAASPAERMAGDWLRPSGDQATVGARLRRWSERIADGRPERVAEILTEHGCTPAQWRNGLGEVTAIPGAVVPEWVEAAVALIELVGTERVRPSAPRLIEVTGPGLPEWVDPDQPWRFHAGFSDWLAAARRDVDDWTAAAPVSEQACRSLVLDLARRQLVICGPVLMEVAGRRPVGEPLFAADARADWELIWSTYPVLSRLMATVWRQWRETTEELCRRISTDLPTLCTGAEVIAVDRSAGDQHGGGRNVARLRLSDGTSLFLKPRTDGLRRVLSSLLGQLDEAGPPLGIRLPVITERAGFTWVHEVKPGDCADDASVEAYFYRAGALLRLTQALGSTDLHHENFVPAPDQPVLVDLETVLAPGALRIAQSEDVVSRRLSDTPGPTSMVTSVVSGPPGRMTADIGALAGPGEALTPYSVPTLVAGPNGPELREVRVPLTNGAALPTRDGVAVSLRGHEAALLDGYADVQARLSTLALAEPLPETDPEPTVRLVLRPTRTYARILLQSTAPTSLVNGVEREFVLELLYRATGTAPPGLIAAEVEAMRDLDIPLFVAPLSRTDLVTDRGAVLLDALSESAGTRSRNRLRHVTDDAGHVDDLRATLFSMDPQPVPSSDLDRGADAGVHVETRGPAELDPSAPADLLLRRAIEVGDGTLAWIGLEHDPNRNRWTYGRLGAGLTGQAGIGLALAGAAIASAADASAGRQTAYAAAARAALLGSVQQVGTGASGPADAFGGPAGVLYAAAAAGRLLGDQTLIDAARSLILPCLRAARRDEPSLVIDGTAGAILALLQLPEDAAVADALTELADARTTETPSDAPDEWSRSLPSRRWGTALAELRLARARGQDVHAVRLPACRGAGDAIAGAAERPPDALSRPIRRQASMTALLDEAELARAALRRGGGQDWALQLDQLTGSIRSRRATTGRWYAPLIAPDTALLSAVHGLSALSLVCTDLPPHVLIARALL